MYCPFPRPSAAPPDSGIRCVDGYVSVPVCPGGGAGNGGQADNIQLSASLVGQVRQSENVIGPLDRESVNVDDGRDLALVVIESCGWPVRSPVQ